jgi:transposase
LGEIPKRVAKKAERRCGGAGYGTHTTSILQSRKEEEMGRRPVSMRKTLKILRLRHESGLSIREIARSVGISHGTVVAYLRRAREAGIGWPVVTAGDEEQLRSLLYSSEKPPREARRALPDMAVIHRELRKKGITLQLLWEEYRAEHPAGYGYTQFCEYYKRFRSRIEPTLRQVYKAGEKLFVDWAGPTMSVVNPGTGSTQPTFVFVAVLGCSDYLFATAFRDRQLASWIEAHIRTWEFYGGVARITVPDNEKTAVTRACRYEPELHRSYEDLAEHYGTVIIPARAREPRDKAKAEQGVQHVERRVLAALRHQTFFSLAELNKAIRKEIEALNARPFQKLPGCRTSLFLELEKAALLPLPLSRYELGTWRTAKANIDYHVQVDWHFYSVPYRLANHTVEVHLSARMVEIFYRGKRVALHARSFIKGGYTTDPAHRPKSHARHMEWTPGRLVSWAKREVGPHCSQVVAAILDSRPHPEQGYRSCLGIMRLARQYGIQRLERACNRALLLEVCSYRSINSMLKTGMDKQALPSSEPDSGRPTLHDNLRGKAYYGADQSAAEV